MDAITSFTSNIFQIAFILSPRSHYSIYRDDLLPEGRVCTELGPISLSHDAGLHRNLYVWLFRIRRLWLGLIPTEGTSLPICHRNQGELLVLWRMPRSLIK